MNTQEANNAQMYDAQLEKLIDLALIDGSLTEKKKQILMKKAEQMGIDLDEFEMVLEAKLYSKNQENPKKHKQSNMDDEVENDEEDDDEASSGFLTPEFLVRVASIITGVFILAMLVFVVKVKFIDKYLIDSDSKETVVTALPSGYTATNDTVTATADLNLRSVPSAAEKSTVVTVAQNGTTMKRIAVSDDGAWALVEYEGQQLYASMKYLSTP